VDDRPDLPVSFVAETNKGGVPMTLCSCGVVLVTGDFAWGHINNCPAAAATPQEDR
jgi:hypothetical protein